MNILKDIPDYEGLYAATKDGRIFSYPKPCSSKDGIFLKLQVMVNKKDRTTPHKQLIVGLHKNGKRKQDTISSIITMLTDNSKENYVSKLGMHPNVVGLVTNMVALGIPLNEAVLVSNTEIMRDIFSKAATKKDR